MRKVGEARAASIAGLTRWRCAHLPPVGTAASARTIRLLDPDLLIQGLYTGAHSV